MDKIVYLDNAASTPIDPRVATVMAASFDVGANPSSVHGPGRDARRLIEASRDSVAELLRVDPTEVVFTSGATEANNMIIFGAYAEASRRLTTDRPLHAIISSIEHPSVTAPMNILADRHGVEVETLPVDSKGRVILDDLGPMIRAETFLVGVMWANNIFGTLQPVSSVAAIVKMARNARKGNGLPLYFFSDAVQAVETQPVYPRENGLDLMSLSGHKIHAPKGVGILYIRSGTELLPHVLGGQQESGRRAGTENLPGIVGFGKAAEILRQDRETEALRLEGLRTRLIKRLSEDLPEYRVLGSGEESVPNIVYLHDPKEDGDIIALKLDTEGIAVASGAACDVGTRKPSRALGALGNAAIEKRGGIRASFGRQTSEEDVDKLVRALQ